MPETRLEIQTTIEKMIKAFNAGDLNGLTEVYTDDAELFWPGFGELKGRPALRELWKKQFDACPGAKTTLKRMVIEGNLGVVEAEFTGFHKGLLVLPTGQTIPPTGKQISMISLVIGTMEEGKIKSERHYFDTYQNMVDLGVLPVAEAVAV